MVYDLVLGLPAWFDVWEGKIEIDRQLDPLYQLFIQRRNGLFATNMLRLVLQFKQKFAIIVKSNSIWLQLTPLWYFPRSWNLRFIPSNSDEFLLNPLRILRERSNRSQRKENLKNEKKRRLLNWLDNREVFSDQFDFYNTAVFYLLCKDTSPEKRDKCVPYIPWKFNFFSPFFPLIINFIVS